MPDLLQTFTPMALRSCLRTCAMTVLLVPVLLTSFLASANCPNPAPATPAKTPTKKPAFDTKIPTDTPINIESDGLDALKEGTWQLNGDVTITQGDRQLKTRDATYDPDAQTFATQSNVEYADPTLRVRGTSAEFDPAAGAKFEDAEFELPIQQGRGSATEISATRDGEVALDDVRYTTCPVGNEDWVIRASDININQQHGIGVGHGVRLDFKGVPIFYTPFISFPVGDERKSGFLFPVIGNSGRSGYMVSAPWYWNIAPNYDATFVPTWYSKRGALLDTQFRYLSDVGQGELNAQYLPHDDSFGSSRSLLQFTDKSDFTEHLRLNIAAANASDSQWFEDFGLGPEGTSVSYLSRNAALTYLTDNWLVVGRMQNYQTIDDQRIAPQDRPYTLLPQIAAHASLPDQPFGLNFGLDMELANFERGLDDAIALNEKGWRADIAPEIRMPLRGSGVYLEPAASWRYTTYDLDNRRADESSSPHRSLPILSVDGGMTFERPSGSRQQRVQTLEPRFMYLYVPYRSQDNLPLFDTGAADLNLVELFRTNRYVGADRMSNANQVSIGMTSRLLSAATGQQYLTATVGQAYYFDEPKVALPNETLNDRETSDLIAELTLTAYRNWNVRMGVQYDPSESRSEKGDVLFQYQPRHDQVMNLGYRFRRDSIEQIDGSVAWPVTDQWSAYARMVYSLKDSSALDEFAGVEYRSCCWKLRLVGRRYVSNRDGDMDTTILLQLELNGLSSVGTAADTFLQRSIRGYSSDDPLSTKPSK